MTKRAFSSTPPKPLGAVPFGLIANANAKSIEVFDQHPGFGLTAKKINAAHSAAEMGWPAQQCDLHADVVEQDGHLRSQLEARLRSILGCAWNILPGGPSPEDARVAALFDEHLHDVPNVMEMLAHQAKAQWGGYNGSEIRWEYDGQIIKPTWFDNVKARRFKFTRPGDTARLLIDQNLTDGIELEAGRWIFTRAFGESTVRAGLLRTCIWYSMFKRMSLRDWVIFAERFGIPYVTGQYNERASTADKATLEEAIMSLGKDGAAMFAETCKIVMHEVKGGGRAEDVHGALATYCDGQISKLVRGATTSSDHGGPGSFALARVQQDTTFVLTQADALLLEQSLEQQLLRPWVVFNGFQARTPRMLIHVVQTVDPVARMKNFADAQAMGLDISKHQIRTEYQIKEPIGPGDVLKPPAPAPKPGAPAAPGGGDPQRP